MFKKNYWKIGLKDNWKIEKLWGQYVWIRYDRMNNIVGYSSIRFRNKILCEKHASKYGYQKENHSEPSNWIISKETDDTWIWQYAGNTTAEIIQESHTSWVKKKDCIANAQRHGYIKT